MRHLKLLPCMMVLALLMSVKIANAQSLNPWPSSISGLAVKADTLFICADIDTIHPIELGYDVPDAKGSGFRLHPNYGTWSLYAISDDASPSDYSVSEKNSGAGNAFKVVGSGIGGYLFRYLAKDAQCGLNVGQSYFVYVFIIPKLKMSIMADTSVCKQSAGTTLPTNINNYFPYKELYDKAKIVSTWSPATFPAIKLDSVHMAVYSSTLTVTSPSGAVGCGNSGLFNYSVEVKEGEFTLDPVTLSICPNDTLDNIATKSPNDFFKRQNGTYSPSVIGSNWGGAPKNFTFTYTDCAGTNKTVVDALNVTNSPPDKNWGRDTLFSCRNKLADISNLYSLASGKIKAPLSPTSGKWFDRGVTGTLPLTFGPSGSSIFDAATSSIDVTAAGSNIGYNFLYLMDPSTCFGGDSGLFILIVQDPFVAVDFRTQMCTDHLNSAFSLGDFTGIRGAAWSYDGSLSATVGAILKDSLTATQLKAMGDGTHKLKYNVAAGCGDGGVGVMYIKIGAKASIPATISERYCKRTLPATINVNEIIGYSGYVTTGKNQWVLTAVSGSAVLTEVRKYFDPATGVFDITGATGNPATNLSIANATNASPVELTFQLTNATCIPGGGSSQLKVIIVDDITQ